MSAACAATAVASIGTAAKAPTIKRPFILCPLFRLEDVWFLDRKGARPRARTHLRFAISWWNARENLKLTLPWRPISTA